MDHTEIKALTHVAVLAALEGGKEILDVYENTIEVEYKDDKSPLTIADKRAHLKIVDMLKDTGIPVLSEEGRELAYEERKDWDLLWVVDPLDGTKEFIKRNGEFTVNIALVKSGVPIMGVIYVPVGEIMYFGASELGAYRVDQAMQVKNTSTIQDWMGQGYSLPQKQERPYTMVGSRSHMSQETTDFFDKVRIEHPDLQVISKGSSLKICMVAEGSADVYPRFAPTMEWDTAAGHAVAKGAGFEVYQAKNDSKPLEYNKVDLLNPWFIVKKPS
jgi:3'(2'), 5'-bisphosphate nucleotidase